MHRLNVHAAAAALALVGVVLAAPASTHAQGTTGTVTVNAFGHHVATGTMPNFAVQPIGRAECGLSLPITITGLNTGSTMHYFNIYTGAASAVTMCAMGATRASTTTTMCRHIGDIPYTSGMSYLFGSTPETTLSANSLMGGTCSSNTFSVMFFDGVMANDVSTTFTTYWVLTLTVDADPPSAPILADNIAGDSTLSLSWTNPVDIGVQGGVNVYLDPNGCGGGDGGAASSVLVAGNPAPVLHAAQQLSMTITSTSIQSSLAGWSSSTHGEHAAIAITVLDSALNESPLSNVICAEHVLVSGFWEQYCADHGMPDIAECTNNYHGCSVAIPSRRTDLGAVSFMIATLGLLAARARRRAR